MPNDRSFSGQGFPKSRIVRFVEKYLDSPAKTEVFRILTGQPNEFKTMAQILALTELNPAEVKKAMLVLRGQNLIQVKESPSGQAYCLPYDTSIRRLLPALATFLEKEARGPSRHQKSKKVRRLAAG